MYLQNTDVCLVLPDQIQSLLVYFWGLRASLDIHQVNSCFVIGWADNANSSPGLNRLKLLIDNG